MPDLYVYTTPASAQVTLTLDSGQRLTGEPCSANGRSDAHKLTLPNGTPTQGSLLEVSADGYTPFTGRGITVNEGGNPPQFVFDDVHLQPLPAAPPTPEPPPAPNPHADPAAICLAVFEQGAYDLSTKEGCGTYTEACVEALHAQQSAMWGHIRKTPSQNHWNYHAVDAVLLLAAAGATAAGGYDIIWSTESPDARPIWTYKGPDPTGPDHWYYGPMPCPPL